VNVARVIAPVHITLSLPCGEQKDRIAARAILTRFTAALEAKIRISGRQITMETRTIRAFA